ncbi:MAG: DNA gyrase subunit A [Acidimicrobiales bacterium]
MLSKSMWFGTTELDVHDEYLIDGAWHQIKYSPAWYKCIDEIIVNALDHNTKEHISRIEIEYKNDTITIYNDGPGIEVAIHKSNLKYIPELIFGTEFKGSNIKQDSNSITGGTNGLGAKLTNIFSTEMSIETVDMERKLHYYQKWWNNMSKKTEPVITEWKKGMPSGTKISFKLDQERLGIHTDVDLLLKTRAYYAALYAEIKVYYNKIDVSCTLKSILHLLFPSNPPIFYTKLNIENYTWQIAAIIDTAAFMLSIVNGVVVRSGSHFKYIYSCILKHLTHTFNRATLSFIHDNVSLVIVCRVPCPKWTGQRKDVLDINMKSVVLNSSFLSSIIKALPVQIPVERRIKSALVDDPRKYRRAIWSGTRKSHLCTLFIVEGDSAMTQVITGISNAKLGFEKFGVLSTGGVIINVRREIKRMPNGTVYRTTKMQNNEFIKAFLFILGLSISSDSKTSLRYGRVIGCVDQDLDGNNIFGLILNMFECLWPNLIRSGFIQKLSTPIIRVYPLKSKKDPLEFYTEHEFAKHKITSGKILYYKGLGTHSKKEIISIFSSFEQHTIQFKTSPNSHNIFEIYYGSDPEKRKIELSRPIISTATTINNSVEEFLQYDVFLYQKDNLDRKLDSAIDGMNQSARKIYDGLTKYFASKNESVRVDELGGYIAEREQYHHGSLNDSITGKGYTFVGGKQLPYIVPLSQFGSRRCGGSDAASPRYINCRFNAPIMSLIFPPEDYYLLSFHNEEGHINEPFYFCPIIPMAIIESTERPAHGWKIQTWGRDVFSVIQNVIRLIHNVAPLPMPPNKYNWTGYFLDEYCFGRYELISPTSVHITELPLGEWTDNYVLSLQSLPNFLKLIDNSDDVNISIIVTFSEPLPESESLYEFLHLRKKMHHFLNFLGTYNEVISFKTYTDVLYYWFPVRKQLYAERIERIKILLMIKISMYKNIIRYINENPPIKHLPLVSIKSLLESLTYDTFNKSLLKSAKYIKNSDLKAQICLPENGASYSYLLDITDHKRSLEYKTKFQTKLNTLENKLESLNTDDEFPGKKQWLSELQQLIPLIKHGQSTDWLYNSTY